MGFVGLQVVLALAVETVLPQIRDPHYYIRFGQLQKRLRDAGAKRRLVLILGSSRTQYGFDGKSLEAGLASKSDGRVVVYNYSIPGGGPGASLLNLRRLLDSGVKPDLLLLEVMPVFLYGSAEPLEANWLDPVRLRRQDIPLLARFGFPGLDAAWRESVVVPWYSHRFALVSQVAARWVPIGQRLDRTIAGDDWGCVAHTLNPRNTHAGSLAVARDSYYDKFQHFKLGHEEVFFEVLETCRREGIPVALVLMPEGPTFRGWYAPETLRAIEGFLDRAQKKYDAAVIDARTWMGEEHFSDSHHLVTEGAKRFTRRVVSEVAPLLPER